MTAFPFAILNSCPITGRVAILNYCPIRRLLFIHHLAFLTNQRRLHPPSPPWHRTLTFTLLKSKNQCCFTQFTSGFGHCRKPQSVSFNTLFIPTIYLRLPLCLNNFTNSRVSNPGTEDSSWIANYIRWTSSLQTDFLLKMIWRFEFVVYQWFWHWPQKPQDRVKHKGLSLHSACIANSVLIFCHKENMKYTSRSIKKSSCCLIHQFNVYFLIKHLCSGHTVTTYSWDKKHLLPKRTKCRLI